MKKSICGVMMDDLSKKEITAEIKKRLAHGEKTVIFTPNPIMVERTKRNSNFLEVLNSSSFNVPDGSGIILASRLLKTPIKERVCGIELGEAVLRLAAHKGYGVYLLGGGDGIAKEAAARLSALYKGLRICGYSDGYGQLEKAPSLIKSSDADIVLVCLGSPKQELWINEHRELGNVRLFMGLGGSLDVWSGRVRRAPKPIRKIGFEWLWRIAAAPAKIKNVPLLFCFGIGTIKNSAKSTVKLHIRTAKFRH